MVISSIRRLVVLLGLKARSRPPLARGLPLPRISPKDVDVMVVASHYLTFCSSQKHHPPLSRKRKQAGEQAHCSHHYSFSKAP